MSGLDLYMSSRGEGGFFCWGLAMLRLGEEDAGDRCPRWRSTSADSTWLPLEGSTLAGFCFFCDKSCTVFHPFIDIGRLDDSSFWVPLVDAL